MTWQAVISAREINLQTMTRGKQCKFQNATVMVI